MDGSESVDDAPVIDRITAAARWLLSEQGSGAVSMRKVAALAGISAMAIYRYFPTREAMLANVAEAAFAERAEIWAAKPRSEPADARLHEAVDDHLDFALSEPRLYDYLFLERRDTARRYPDDFAGGSSPTLSIVVDALTDGVTQGQFAIKDVGRTALMLAAFMHGMVQLYRGDRIGVAEPEFRALCHDLAEGMIDGFRG